MIKSLIAIVAITGNLNGAAIAGETPSNESAKQYFISPQDGDVIKGPVKVIFGLSGMGVAPAGIDMENTGHHHIFVNRPALGEWEDGADELDANIITDDQHIHFGKGQTETMLDLPKGTHTLQLVLGDKDHIPHNPPITSDIITITVE